MKSKTRVAKSTPESSRFTGHTFNKAILVCVQLPDMSDARLQRSLAELEFLVRDLGYDVVAQYTQKREQRDSSNYLGAGRIQAIATLTGGPGHVVRGPGSSPGELNSEFTVFVDDELTPGQERNLELALGATVLDRVRVILKIFESRARTPQSKLEIELAKLEYDLPRVRDNHSLGDKEGGGGRASRGHSNVELAKQRMRERMAHVKRELARLSDHTARQVNTRLDLSRVALVGYTNAGKSTLMRLLTGSDVLIQDKLFATLGTTTRQLCPPATPPVLITDTVGFMDRLPLALMASFQSTLAEAREAGLILQIIDITDSHWPEQLELTSKVLDEIGVKDAARWMIFNKVDRLLDEECAALQKQFPAAILMNALDPCQGKRLRQRIISFFQDQMLEVTLKVPYAKQGLLAEFKDRIHVLKQEYDDDITVVLKGSPQTLAQLRRRLSHPSSQE